jgi:hypothetical protein
MSCQATYTDYTVGNADGLPGYTNHMVGNADGLPGYTDHIGVGNADEL